MKMSEIIKLWEMLPKIVCVVLTNENLIRTHDEIRSLENDINNNSKQISDIKVINDNLKNILKNKRIDLEVLIDIAIKDLQKDGLIRNEDA